LLQFCRGVDLVASVKSLHTSLLQFDAVLTLLQNLKSLHSTLLQFDAACLAFDLAQEEKQRMPGQLTDQALSAFLGRFSLESLVDLLICVSAPSSWKL
jgi:hypothetical protein